MTAQRLVIENEPNDKEIQNVQLNLHLSAHLILLSVVSLASGRTLKIIKEALHPSLGLIKQLDDLLPLVSPYRFETINLCLYHQDFNLIPAALFDENLINQYLNIDSNAKTNYKSYSKVLEKEQMVVLSCAESYWISKLSEKAKQVKVSHFCSTMIQVSAANFNHSDDQIHAHIWDNMLYLLYYKGGKVQFYNQFYFQTPEDFLYHSLNCLEQLELDPGKIKLILTGQVHLGTKIQELAYTYFGKIQFGSAESDSLQRGAIGELPSHEYLYVFKQHLCE